MDVYENLKVHNIQIPPPMKPGGIFTKMRRIGDSELIFTSGCGCKNGDAGLVSIGQAGNEATFEQAQQAARQCILNLVSNMQEELGDLNKVKKIVKILGFVASADTFYDQAKVMNAASELLMQIFGDEIGCSARSAIGTNRLPSNQTVEIEMIFLAD